MFRIKICGITTPADAQSAVAAGADAIGLNFFAASPRRVSLEQARPIVAAVGDRACKVGLFVNHSAAEICQRYDELGLDLVQLHGDEPAELLAALAGRPVMRAFRSGGDFRAVAAYLARCGELRCLPRLVLVDALSAGRYGGTGVTADWQAIAEHRTSFGEVPLVLAGGLRPDNVAQAIAAVRPDAVDTASGVESSPGVKSPELVRAFVDAARKAFGAG